MSKTPNYNAKVKEILDRLEPGERVCDLTGEKWFMDEREIGWYKKFNVPPSKCSPLTRKKLINSYFVIFDIWYNKHAETSEPIITNFHPATGIKVLPDKEWFERDFISEGREVDLSKPLVDQMYELGRAVPRAAGYNYVQPENSLAFISMGDKDSYFVLACQSKRCFLGLNGYGIEDCVEFSMINNSQSSYNVVHSDRIHNCRFVRESQDCINCDFIFDCRNCEFCFGATNKRNKKFLFFNEQLSEKEWHERVKKINLTLWSVRQEYEQKFRDLISSAIWPENFNINATNSTGEYLTNTNNLRNCYYSRTPGTHDCEDCSYIVGDSSNNCYMVAAPIHASNCYYGVGMQGHNLKFSYSINTNCSDCEYCECCYECTFCFGCTGLRHKKYCILNKQYSEDEYWEVLDKVKCQMVEANEYGDLPPAYFSTQVYTGSGAGILFGSNMEEGKKLGAVEIDPRSMGAEGPEVESNTVSSLDQIPDQVENINNLIGKPFLDPKLNRRYTYIKPELDLYQKLKIAPPRMHPVARAYSLYNEINMPIFNQVDCTKCGQEITVALNRAYPDRKIYCKLCYHKYLEKNS